MKRMTTTTIVFTNVAIVAVAVAAAIVAIAAVAVSSSAVLPQSIGQSRIVGNERVAADQYRIVDRPQSVRQFQRFGSADGVIR